MATKEYFRRKNQETPILHLRLPSPDDMADLENVAVANSTTKSGFARNAVLKAIKEEQAKQNT